MKTNYCQQHLATSWVFELAATARTYLKCRTTVEISEVISQPASSCGSLCNIIKKTTVKKLTFILTYILASILSYGQNNDLPQRNNFTLHLAVDDTVFYNSEIKASSYILPENTIQLYPGENIFVEVELVRKEIKSMKTVKENLNPAKTIKISFSQETDDTDSRKHRGMMLEIENPFDKKLEYEAQMYLMNHNKWVVTDVLPIQPNLSSYELWNDIIVTIALTGWKFK